MVSVSNTQEPDGVLIVDKPAGWTSHDVVGKVRGIFHTKRVGHAGTLDPLATGVLVLLIGKATKASQYLMSRDKTYEGVLRLGQVTNTQDSEGEIMENNPVPADLDAAAIAAAMRKMEGDQYQMPPMFSAKKLGGVPLYKLARKGKEVEREPRFIHVEKFELLSYAAPDAAFRVSCSKGTYVRTLANDLGRALGPGAHLTALRRTVAGEHTVEQASTLEELAALPADELVKRLIPLWRAVPSHVL
jgi:tRNA pseudouridine55 synthase